MVQIAPWLDLSEQVGADKNVMHAGHFGHGAGVEAGDPRVRVRAAQNPGVQHPRQAEIINELRGAGEECEIFTTWKRLTDVPSAPGVAERLLVGAHHVR